MDSRVYDLGPEALQRVENSRLRAVRRAARRELAIEVGVAGAFLAGALALAASSAGSSPRLGLACGLIVLYALLLHVRFEVGEGHTHPLQLIFVPMLVLLPPGEVPLAVAAAHLAAVLIKIARRQASAQRAVVAVADASYSLAPALIFAVLGPTHSMPLTVLLVVGALFAQLGSDLAVSAVRLGVGLELDPRVEMRGFAWVALTDWCLAPVGLLAALAGQWHPIVVALLLPLAGLLAIFARERRGRLANALELQRLAQEGHDRLEAIVHNSSDLIVILDADGTLRMVTGLVGPIFGSEPDPGRGERLTDRVHPDDRASVTAFLAAVATTGPGDAQEIQWRMRYADGSHRHIESVATNLTDDPSVRGIVITARDVEARKAFEEQLRHRAFHDALTGLANRALFFDRIEHAFQRRPREATKMGVLFVDVDEFKPLNDTRGHAVGDRVLEEVAARILSCLRRGDTAARLGGDEFGVLLETVAGQDTVIETATRVARALSRPYRFDDAILDLSASVGVAISSPGERSVEELLRKADLAMYKAKRTGRARVQLYDPAMEREQAGSSRAAWFARADEQRDEISALLADPDALRMVFQPIMDLRSGRVTSYEALMRVKTEPRRGPDLWIAQAHRCGLGHALEARAITLALATPDRPPGTHLTVNMSPSSLTSDEVLRALPDELEGIVIEITENELVSGDPDLRDALARLRQRGALLAVDDTGAGYAGLTHVMRLRPNIIKLDRALTNSVDTDPAKAALISSFVRFARDIAAAVCAEGVETLAELEHLADLDVAFGQGYVIARPGEPWVPADHAAQQSCLRSFRASVEPPPRTGYDQYRDGREELTRRIADVANGAELDRCLPAIARELHADEVCVERGGTLERAGIGVIADVPGTDPAALGDLRAGAYHSSLTLMLTHRGDTVGYLRAYRRTERPWSRFEIREARLLSNGLAPAVARSLAPPPEPRSSGAESVSVK